MHICQYVDAFLFQMCADFWTQPKEGSSWIRGQKRGGEKFGPLHGDKVWCLVFDCEKKRLWSIFAFPLLWGLGVPHHPFRAPNCTVERYNNERPPPKPPRKRRPLCLLCTLSSRSVRLHTISSKRLTFALPDFPLLLHCSARLVFCFLHITHFVGRARIRAPLLLDSPIFQQQLPLSHNFQLNFFQNLSRLPNTFFPQFAKF